MSRGRHRRPHTPIVSASAAASAGAVAAVGIAAVGVVAAPAADAATAGVWDRVAACESSNRWHVNTGNHFYGGVQFWQATWIGYGGQKYAPRADIATRRQQIAVAKRVLASQGPHAWPVCSKRAKLTKANGDAKSSPLPDIGPYVHTVPAKHHPSAHHSGTQHHGTQHRSRQHPAVHRYVVRAGDSLSGLADRFHVHGGWTALWHYNRTNVPNPNVIFVGQVLQIP